MIENIEAVLSLASAAIGFATAFFVVLRKFTNSEKVRKWTEILLEVEDKAQHYMKIAEANDLLDDGEKRREFVVEKIQSELERKGYDVPEDTINTVIEKLIDLTKHVNRK